MPLKPPYLTIQPAPNGGFTFSASSMHTMHSTNNTVDAMHRDELVRLAGEQALLGQELKQLSAEQHRDKQALQGIFNDIGRTTDWHARGTQLLDRIKEREDKMAAGQSRLREYSKSTGIQ